MSDWSSFPEVQSAGSGAPLRITVRPKGAEQGAGEWDQFPEVSTWKDVGKSAAIAPVKAAIGMAGMGGDLGQLIRTGADKIAGAVGLPEGLGRRVAQNLTVGPLGPLLNGPTSQTVRDTIEGYTGPLYEPQTRAGRYVQTGGEFATAAALGPAGGLRQVLGNMVRYGAIPGVVSEAAGETAQRFAPGAETYARAGAALATGGVAALLSRPATAERALRNQLPAYVTDAHVGQAEALIGDAAQRGINLTWPEALSQVTGRPVLTDMQRVLESHPRTRAAMQEVVGDRPQQVQQAAQGEFGAISAPSQAPSAIGPAVRDAAHDTVTDVRQAINAAAEPFYRNAEGVLLTPQEMVQVRAIPGYAEAADAVRNSTQLNRNVANLPENSVGFLNQVKKYLDASAKNAGTKFNPAANQEMAAGYGADAAAVRNAAVTASPAEYGAALAIESIARERYLQPLLDGPLGKLAKKDITTQKAIEVLFPEKQLAGRERETAQAVRALQRRNPWAAQQLVRAHLEQKLDEAFSAAGRGQEAAQFAGASFANRLTGSPVIAGLKADNLRAAIEALPNGRQVWPGFQRFLEVVQATGTRQPIGSKTAFNEQELRGMATGSAVGNLTKTGLAPGKWWSLAHDSWSKWQFGRNMDQLAAIIANPRAGRDFERIARMPIDSREAQVIAARLLASTYAADSSRRTSK